MAVNIDEAPPPPYDAPPLSQDRKLGPVTIHLDYAKSIPGILKVACIALAIIGFICVAASEWQFCYAKWGAFRFFEFVSQITFWSTIFIYCIFLTGLNTVIRFINWELTELIWSAVDTGFFLIASITLAANSCFQDSIKTAAAFGFFATFAFAGNTFFAFKQFRSRVVLSDSSKSSTATPAVEYLNERY